MAHQNFRWFLLGFLIVAQVEAGSFFVCRWHARGSCGSFDLGQFLFIAGIRALPFIGRALSQVDATWRR